VKFWFAILFPIVLCKTSVKGNNTEVKDQPKCYFEKYIQFLHELSLKMINQRLINHTDLYKLTCSILSIPSYCYQIITVVIRDLQQ